MNKKLLVSLSSMFILAALSIGVYALDATSTNTVKQLSLADAISIAQTSNVDLQKANISYQQAIIDADQARENYEDLINVQDSSQNTINAKQANITAEQKQLAESVAKQSLEITKVQITNQVEKSYYDVIKAQNVKKSKQEYLKRAQDQCNLVQKKFKAGYATKVDVNKAQIAFTNAQTDLTNADQDLKLAKMALNKLLGIDVNQEYQFVAVLKYEKVTPPTVDQLAKQILENRLSIQKAKNAEKYAKINYDLTVGYQGESTYQAKRYKLEWNSSTLDVLQEEQDAKTDAVSAIYQLQKAGEVVDSTAKSLSLAKENYALAQRRYEIGAGTSLDALDASIDLADQENSYADAVYNYIQAKNQLNIVSKVSI